MGKYKKHSCDKKESQLAKCESFKEEKLQVGLPATKFLNTSDKVGKSLDHLQGE